MDSPQNTGKMVDFHRFTGSRTWVNPKVKHTQNRQALNSARRKICPRSPFWHHDFDLDQHKKDWEADRSRHHERKLAEELKTAESRRRIQNTAVLTTPPIRKAFDGKDFTGHYSAVLSRETVFCPEFGKGKVNIAPWPSRTEMKYEGDDRIATELIHGRFPGAPRIASNDTVGWQHRPIIEQYPLDDFYYPIPDFDTIFFRLWRVEEYEFTESAGAAAIGKELMEMLDSDDW